MRVAAALIVNAIIASVVLAACDGSNTLQPAPARGASDALRSPSLAPPGVALRHGIAFGTGVRPNCCVQTLFVSDPGTNEVQLYNYPLGSSQGQLPQPTLPAAAFNTPQGECVDGTNPQHVFITNTNAFTIDEYTHAGAFVMQLTDPGEYPVSCAYRQTGPTSGVLAVGNIYATGSLVGSISVYTNTAGVWAGPTIYTPGSMYQTIYFVAYKGNTLYFDGIVNSAITFYFMKMSPSGGFTPITLSGVQCSPINFPGGVQQVNNYLAVGDQLPNAGCPNIYHVLPSGAVIGSTTLSPSPSDIVQFTRKGSRIVAPDVNGSPPNADIYKYNNGPLLTVITNQLVAPIGSAISHQ